MTGKCTVCGGANLSVLYRGPIRVGKFGNLSSSEQTVWQCSACRCAFLPHSLGQSAGYYEGQEYRREVDESAEVGDYFRLHDAEQARNLAITGTSAFRDKNIADVGCGGGSFLDAVSGFAKRTVAIEPSQIFRESLVQRGYVTFPYASEAKGEFTKMLDVITSFSVLEHVEDPLGFLKDIRALLAPGGKLILSTPNTEDALLDALPIEYPRFYFRKAHLWYFDKQSLAKLLSLAGFSRSTIIPHQRFGLSNFLGWLRDKTPQGQNRHGFVTKAMDAAWKAELERTFRCDYLFAEAFAED